MNEQKPNNYFLLQRDWRKSEIFEMFDEPFDKGSAWIYLIENAAWKTRRFLVGSAVHILERGQLTASLRFLAKAWKWSKNKVDVFLKALKAMDMIDVDNGTGQNVITICNYNKYQIDVTNQGTQKGHKRDTKGTGRGQVRDKTKKGNKDNKVKKDNILVTCDFSFEEFYQDYPVKKSKVLAEKKFNQVCKDKNTFDEIMNGLSEFKRWIKATKQHPKYVKHPSTWLNQECWKDELIFAKPPPEPKKQTDNLNGFDKYINSHDAPEPNFENMKDITQ